MKKLLTKILIGILAVTTVLAGLTACDSGKGWQGASMTNWGADVAGATQGGFIVEKENYYYVINGVGSNLKDNTFGAPVKGALMAVDKTDFTKTQIVVPKLFVAEDYNAGLYIYGDYVYYGTPNTDKDSSGEVAITEMTFMRTKLDGTETTKYFTVGTILAEYRIVKSGEDVLIVYYDNDDLALKVFNCTTQTTEVIAKTDAKVEGVKAESLKNFKFTENGSDVIVYYVNDVYAEDYNEDKGEERATESYNKLYGYKAGDKTSEQVAILDGSAVAPNPATYEIKVVKLGDLYYSETINEVAKCYVGLGSDKTRVYNEEVLAEGNLFVKDAIAGIKVYTLTETTIIETALSQDYESKTKNVAIDIDASGLLALNDGFIYFAASSGCISRVKLGDETAKVQQVSADTAYVGWYEITFINGKMFYCDSSEIGASYVNYVDVSDNAVIESEDSDDDGEDDKFSLKGHTRLGIVSDEDKIEIAEAMVDAIASKLEDGVLPFEKDGDGKLFVTCVDEAVVAVKDLDISDETKEKLENYQQAIEMANLYNKLDGIRYETNNKDYKAAYESVKDKIEEFRASEDYSEVSKYIGNNLLWAYQQAKSLYA